MIENRPANVEEFGRISGAWPRQRHCRIERDLPLFEQQDAIRREHGFLDVVRHEDRRAPALRPELFDERLHLAARQRIQAAERFVDQQQQ